MECNYALNGPMTEPCGDQATEIILWGCLEQHTMEFVVCTKHMHHWVTEYHRGMISCAYCYLPGASYLTNKLYNVNKDFQIRLES